MKKSQIRQIIKEEIKKVTNEDMATWIDRSNLDGVGSSLVDHIEQLDWYEDDDDDMIYAIDDLNISSSDFRTMTNKLGTPLNDLKLATYATGEGWDSTGDYAKVSKVYQRPSNYPRHETNGVAFDIDEKNGILFFSKHVGEDTGTIKGFIFN